MQEKERYEIHMYDDCKVDLYDNDVLDKSVTDEWELGKLLNQQDARIKELEEQLLTATMYHDCEALVNELKQENQQLKQTQRQLAIEELEKALVLIQNAVNLESPEYDLVGLYDAIVDQIKSLKGE